MHSRRTKLVPERGRVMNSNIERRCPPALRGIVSDETAGLSSHAWMKRRRLFPSPESGRPSPEIPCPERGPSTRKISLSTKVNRLISQRKTRRGGYGRFMTFCMTCDESCSRTTCKVTFQTLSGGSTLFFPCFEEKISFPDALQHDSAFLPIRKRVS